MYSSKADATASSGVLCPPTARASSTSFSSTLSVVVIFSAPPCRASASRFVASFPFAISHARALALACRIPNPRHRRTSYARRSQSVQSFLIRWRGAVSGGGRGQRNTARKVKMELEPEGGFFTNVPGKSRAPSRRAMRAAPPFPNPRASHAIPCEFLFILTQRHKGTKKMLFASLRLCARNFLFPARLPRPWHGHLPVSVCCWRAVRELARANAAAARRRRTIRNLARRRRRPRILS